MFEHAFDPGSDPKRPFHHVGVEKYRLREHDFAHWFFDDKADKSVRAIDPFRRTKDGRVGAAAEGFTGRSLKFQLREPERVTNPAFNVLYVQTQKPTVLRVPLVRAFLGACWWARRRGPGGPPPPERQPAALCSALVHPSSSHRPKGTAVCSLTNCPHALTAARGPPPRHPGPGATRLLFVACNCM